MSLPNLESYLGTCCGCQQPIQGVPHLIMLDIEAPIAGTGWGCYLCHLPNNGALAVVCNECLISQSMLFEVIYGYPESKQRLRFVNMEEPMTPFHHKANHRPQVNPEPYRWDS